VLVLSGASQAVDVVDVNNGSFEYQYDGNQVTCHMGMGSGPDKGVLGWTAGWLDAPQINAGWSGVDPNCGAPNVGGGDCCRDWHVIPDGQVVCYVDNGNWAHQILDHNIIAGKRYDMVIDGMIWIGAPHDTMRAHFYYLEDPCQPDVNQIDIVQGEFLCPGYLHPTGLTDWTYDLKLTFVAESGAAYDDEYLGIKFSSPPTEDWIWVDDVRVYTQWATQAYGPDPGHLAEEVSTDANLVWSPGLWAKDVNGHMVYFGSTWAEVNSATTTDSEYKATQSPNEWDPGALVLGTTYYWRIDEVNENYDPCTGPVPYPTNGIWKGEIWSFTVQGKARQPNPPDGSEDVARNVILHWLRGAESMYHDIYFGSTEAEVSTATTSSGEYKGRTNLGTEDYDTGGLIVDANYFWRIDEVNYMTVKGDVWDFKVADYILIDDFDYYPHHSALRNVWKDSYQGTAGNGEAFVNKDANFSVGDGNSMMFKYWNDGAPGYSMVTRTYATAQDWSYSGNKVAELEIDFIGDQNSNPDLPMFVRLSDGSTTAQVNPSPNDPTQEWVNTWHIDLGDFSGVNLASITKITLGIGAKAEAQVDEFGTLYFDDIRLHPPRCYPDKTMAADFTGDCIADVCDLLILAGRWCDSGGWYQAAAPSPGPIIEYLFEETSGTVVVNTGSYGTSHNMYIGKGVDPNHDVLRIDPNNDPCWVNDSDPCRGWTLWFDGRDGSLYNTDDADALTGGGGDYLLGMTPLNLTTNTLTIAAWLKPDPWLMDTKKMVYEQSGGFTGILHSREQTGADTHTFGLSYNFTGGYTYNGEIGYEWFGKSATWGYHSDIMIPDHEWTLTAAVIQPDAGIVYVADFNGTPSDTNDDKLLSGTHVYNQAVDDLDGIYAVAADGGIIEGGWTDRFFRGQMDKVCVFNYSLGPGQMLGLAEMEGIVYVPLQADADICVGDKDPCDPCAPVDDQIDLCDFSTFADKWLEKQLWPVP
jgi:hypothetical protein